MKTTAEWLHEIKTVPGKMEAWLEALGLAI